ncbi:MAG: branched-chain amino acid ABC transporter permease, partial [Polyangiaceae bacterium]|nr:branched-chain amino acid ABC transporter permease [Polyangiaceae bacterium]
MSPLLRHILLAAVLVLALFGLEVGFELLVPDAAWRQLALFAMVNVIVALSLNIINGMA